MILKEKKFKNLDDLNLFLSSIEVTIINVETFIYNAPNNLLGMPYAGSAAYDQIEGKRLIYVEN